MLSLIIAGIVGVLIVVASSEKAESIAELNER
ncbi:hypothetical protein SAMN05720606_104142 [Paenibacillus polysaccharolyticus]|uniref:Uncharacterized protein n=1 Tax=Paenibacillus polysaccharolyticus TaxID=582692 RepID=A0A1G5FBD0_9BACL|nr:hypothetical protein [Paenibacillus intestini]SCY36536.1 hypothetical protein SAMN05720606_104142 [Paenibacillus polysaccharolyticus]